MYLAQPPRKFIRLLATESCLRYTEPLSPSLNIPLGSLTAGGTIARATRYKSGLAFYTPLPLPPPDTFLAPSRDRNLASFATTGFHGNYVPPGCDDFLRINSPTDPFTESGTIGKHNARSVPRTDGD